LNLDDWLIINIDDFEWEVLHIALNRLISIPSPNQTFDIENRVLWVLWRLVLRGVTNKAFAFWCEGNVGWCDTVADFVRNDIDLPVTRDGNTGVGGTKIDTDYVFSSKNTL